MKLRIEITSGYEVLFAGDLRQDRPAYFGTEPETGLWRISIPKFQELLSAELSECSFGSSIEEFVFGFEIAELGEWGTWFKKTQDYTSYRPRTKQFVSVGQVEWKDVKDLSAAEQLSHFGAALVTSIECIGTLKRKPKDFDYTALAASVREFLSRCPPAMVIA
jgi:hypothetical protein